MIQIGTPTGEPKKITCVSTIGVEGENWLNNYITSLVNDRFFPLGFVMMSKEFDPDNPEFERTFSVLAAVHEGVANGLVDQVHYTKAVAGMPAIGILRSSAMPQVQFIELDGGFDG